MNTPNENAPPTEAVSVTSNLKVRFSPEIGELAAALSKAQAMMRHPAKNKTAKVKMKSGETYQYNYADLADCIDALREPFAANGLCHIQVPFNTDPEAVGVLTRIMHSSGQWMEGTLHMGCADDRPQTAGSAITYGRRYSLMAMAGASSEEDEDGNLAQGNGGAETAKRTRGAQAAPAAASTRPAPAEHKLAHENEADRDAREVAIQDLEDTIVAFREAGHKVEDVLRGFDPHSVDSWTMDRINTAKELLKARLLRGAK